MVKNQKSQRRSPKMALQPFLSNILEKMSSYQGTLKTICCSRLPSICINKYLIAMSYFAVWFLESLRQHGSYADLGLGGDLGGGELLSWEEERANHNTDPDRHRNIVLVPKVASPPHHLLRPFWPPSLPFSFPLQVHLLHVGHNVGLGRLEDDVVGRVVEAVGHRPEGEELGRATVASPASHRE